MALFFIAQISMIVRLSWQRQNTEICTLKSDVCAVEIKKQINEKISETDTEIYNNDRESQKIA